MPLIIDSQVHVVVVPETKPAICWLQTTSVWR
jgi:hypothetical protein